MFKWFWNVSLLSMYTPRYLTQLLATIEELWSWMGEIDYVLLGGITSKLHLDGLIVSLLALHHLQSRAISKFRRFCKNTRSGWWSKIQMSSAKSRSRLFSALGISLTYKRKNKGTRVDPWGTLYSLGCDFDVWPSRETNWDRLRSFKKGFY